MCVYVCVCVNKGSLWTCKIECLYSIIFKMILCVSVSVKEREQEMYLNEDDAKGFKVVKKDLNGDTKDVA